MFGYVGEWEDWAKYGPLLYCLGFAIENVKGQPVDYFLRAFFSDDKESPSGGDPGWLLYRDRVELGRTIYHAFTVPDASGLDPHEADYDEATVKRLVRRTLENFRAAHPERSNEIDAVVSKYGL